MEIFDEAIGKTIIIPEGEEGVEQTFDDSVRDVKSVDTELLNSDWYNYARQIPVDALEDTEKELLEKYFSSYPFVEQLPDEEIEEITNIIFKFVPALDKIQPDVVLDNIEKNTQIVEDEKEFLKLCDTWDEIQVIPFTYHTSKGEIRMKFDLYPLSDSEAITDITSNISMFKDFTDEEWVTYNKIQNNEKLSREEVLVRARLEEKIQKATQQNQRQTIVEYLSLLLKFHGKDSSITDMREVFKHIPFTYLVLLFNEVQQRNHLSDLKVEKVFQDFDK